MLVLRETNMKCKEKFVQNKIHEVRLGISSNDGGKEDVAVLLWEEKYKTMVGIERINFLEKAWE